ncbi:sugar ABC transporter ATP-binding protein [Streptomyces reniochalinae]|uniref:Sugar ABC transporter ATP-binding protein n=2 Tax=Streptomyces reniochalinae TaxID=2250578 RepID=A0A367F616_9ACTN|nr:multiple monosaccharide ABC transporter ATP-binding protein [Streptomyces reniochalinae]RCG25302.1 sugar ABC transporter ATP-binding protein [Streptomyces reniochalinae]
MRNITKTFPGVTALSDVNLTVRPGEIHAVCGENGAGKSTLMKVLSGVHPHGGYDGEIRLFGEPVAFKDIRASEARGIVIIHQELALVPFLSIAENIFLGNEQRTGARGVVDWNATLQRATRLLRRVGLRENPQTAVADIGVGKQQLVEIAKALSKEVKLLILDEPTAALNDEDSASLLQLILELRDQGIASIVISHKLGEIRSIADTVTILRDGRTIETLTVREDPARPAELSEDRIIRGMVGRDLDHRFPDRTPYEGDHATALEIEGWTVRHPVDHQRKVVDDASLTVRRGEIVGIAGLMGAGRTELAMSVFGRSYGLYEAGTLRIAGRQVRAKTVPAAIEAGLAYVTEDRKRYGLNLIDTINRNISLASLPAMVRRGVVDEHHERSVAERYRNSMNIKAPTVHEQTGRLSGGNQQKVVLSKWIHADPDVLILDEPTRGIDVGAKYEIYTVIDALAAQGKAVLFISSELPELLGMCDRIYTMAEGRLTAEIARADAGQEVLMRHMTRRQPAAGARNRD